MSTRTPLARRVMAALLRVAVYKGARGQATAKKNDLTEHDRCNTNRTSMLNSSVPATSSAISDGAPND